MYYGGGNMVGYIKKEDAHDVAKMQKTMLSVILGGMAFLYGIMDIFVLPRLREIVPSSPKSLMWVSVVFVCLVLVTLTHQYNFSRIDAATKKYSKGEMIKVGLLWDRKYDYFGIGAMIMALVYLAYTVILPISSLTY
jgi:hypothetical protein